MPSPGNLGGCAGALRSSVFSTLRSLNVTTVVTRRPAASRALLQARSPRDLRQLSAGPARSIPRRAAVTELSILPVVAPAATAHNRPAPRWRGYGFLPGYHQPRSNSFQLTPRKLQFSVWRSATGALGISIQSQVITGTMATGTISAGLAFTVVATMAAASTLVGRGRRTGRSGIAAN